MKMIRLSENAEKAIAVLNENGFEAYAVGGCVRDALMGRSVNDSDLTTSATPEQMKKCFSDFRVIETGIRHGTLTVLLDGIPTEITTYRTDGAYSDNRHPDGVSFVSDLKEDLARRDFTVNAMAYHPEIGLVDLFGGQKDLEKRVIRCVGDPNLRFHEDGLRILRALRFASTLDFAVEEKTADAIRSCRELLRNVSVERILTELSKLLCGNGVLRVMLDFPEVFAEILPEIAPTIGFDQMSKYHCYDVYEHIARTVQATRNARVPRLAALFHDIAKPQSATFDGTYRHFPDHPKESAAICEATLRRLHADNETIKTTSKLIRRHDVKMEDSDAFVRKYLAELTPEEFVMLVDLQRADRSAHAKEYRESDVSYDSILERIRKISTENPLCSVKDLEINGRDLQKIGFEPGKTLGLALQKLFSEALDGKIPNEKETLLRRAEELREEFS